MACVIAGNLVALAQPQVLRLAVDDLYRGVTAEKLGRYALILMAIALGAGVFRFAMRMSVIGISRRLEYDLRNELFAHLERMPVSWFQAARTGETMSVATNDMSAVRMMLGPGLMYTVNTITVGIVAIAFMVAISPRLTFWSLLPLPLVSVAVWWFGDHIHRLFERVQQRFADLSAHVQENLAGVRVVRAFASEPGQVGRFDGLNAEYMRENETLIRTSSVFYPALALFSGIGALLALWIGGREAVLGRITLGQFVAFTVYLGMLNWPMVALGWVINIFQRGMASYGRICAILETPPAIDTPAAPRHLPAPRARGAIEFRDVTFTYPGSGEPALHNVSFQVPPGRTVALVGRTGSGKSTVLALLPRLFDPPPGTVFVDGIDVRDLDLAALRANLAVVPQETFLFSATMAENVALGVEHAGAAEIARAARVADLERDVLAFPEQWHTRVGERGITLSGGQKQRTAIARAILRDAPILLLDDSSVLRRHPYRGRHPRRAGGRDAAAHHAARLAPGEHRARRRRDPRARPRPHRRARPSRQPAALDGGHYADLHRAQQLREETRGVVSEHEEELGRTYDHRLMRRLLQFLRPYRATVAGGHRA